MTVQNSEQGEPATEAPDIDLPALRLFGWFDAEHCRAVERVLDGALGPDSGTGEGLAADVALVVRQRDEARALVADLRTRLMTVRESNHEGYVQNRDQLIAALGPFVEPNSRSIARLISHDVVALREAHEALKDELRRAEWNPSNGDRATGTDLDGRTVTGTVTGFFAWNHEAQANDRAYLELDDGITTVVTTASLRHTEE